MTPDHATQSSADEASASMQASRLIVRAQRGLSAAGASMHDNLHPEAAGLSAALLSKFLPAGLGALIMVAVDMPQTKRELFWRIFVAMASSFLFGDMVFDLLQTFSLFSFLTDTKRSHVGAVYAIVGGAGWFVLGGASMWLRKFKGDPAGAIAQAKDAAK